MNYCYGKGAQKRVLCWEVVPILRGSFIGRSTAAPPRSSTRSGPPRVRWDSCRPSFPHIGSKTTVQGGPGTIRGRGRRRRSLAARPARGTSVRGMRREVPRLHRSLGPSGATLHLSTSPGAVSPAGLRVAPPTMGVAPTSTGYPPLGTCRLWW